MVRPGTPGTPFANPCLRAGDYSPAARDFLMALRSSWEGYLRLNLISVPVMADEGRYAVATVVLSGREQVVLIRPVGRLLAATVLSYDAQLKKPAAFEDEVPDVDVGGEEVKLARSLVEASTAEEFDVSKYR